MARMQDFNAIGEYRVELTDELAGEWIDALAGYSPAISRTPRNLTEVVITYPAKDIGQAIVTGHGVLNTRIKTELFMLEVLPTDEFDRRAADVGMPSMVTTVEAAEIIGITRQRVLQLVESGAIPSERVGDRTLVLPRVTVESIARARREGKTVDG